MTRRVKQVCNSAWCDKAIAATRGTQFGAIVACALGVERDATPRFVGKGIVTSDGFLMCGFVDRNGTGHHGALVGAMADCESNISGLSKHLGLSREDDAEFRAVMKAWISQDYR